MVKPLALVLLGLRRPAQQGFVTVKRSAQQGFTLLEMLVALTVFSLAALALVRLQAIAVRSTADLDERQTARIVAHNMMVDMQTSSTVPGAGKVDGITTNAGQQWRWVRTVAKSEEQGIVRVDVRVTRRDGNGSPAVLSFLVKQP